MQTRPRGHSTRNVSTYGKAQSQIMIHIFYLLFFFKKEGGSMYETYFLMYVYRFLRNGVGIWQWQWSIDRKIV